MDIVIRVDVSLKIGTGHFMRCMTLADALKKKGNQICFVSRHLPEYLRSLLMAKGHEFRSLERVQDDAKIDNGAYAHWLGTTQVQDAANSIAVLSDRIWDWLIIDHYAIDFRWETLLRQIAKNIFVIDDLADRKHDCDVLLDQNFYANMHNSYADKVPQNCQLLLGPRYALLRHEFMRLRDQVRMRQGNVKRVLVFFGGVDEANYTGRAIQALLELGNSDLHVDVVVGAKNPHLENVKAACSNHSFYCHIQTDKMAELMLSADVAIGAGGGANWERCCMGLPTIAITTAENQQKQIANAAQEGFIYAPKFGGSDLVLFLKIHLKALLQNEHLRQFISKRSMEIVDGRGTLRVIRELNYNEIEIREAHIGDLQSLFEWRNSSPVRSVSRNSNLIAIEDHQKWFNAIMNSSDRTLLIGQVNGNPVGVVRFDKQGNKAEVSIYLVSKSHSGQGGCLLLCAEQWVKDNRHDIKYLRANVLAGNYISQRLFLGAGYIVDSTYYSKKI